MGLQQPNSGTKDVIKREMSFKLGATKKKKEKVKTGSQFLPDLLLPKTAPALSIMALSSPYRHSSLDPQVAQSQVEKTQP